jgi:hypothetical protein
MVLSGFQNPVPSESITSQTYTNPAGTETASTPCVYVKLSTLALNNRWHCYDPEDDYNFTITADEEKYCPYEVYLLSNGILELSTPE